MSKKYTTNFLEDTNASTGSANQVLVSTASGVDWVDGSGSGIIGGPYLPLAGGTMSGNLTISIPDGGSAPAMTNTLFMKGYEGRGIGMKLRDSANSATGASNREWFVGSGYSNSGFNIGYSATGSSSSYSAQSKFNITTGGVVTILGNVGIGTTSPNTKLDVNGVVVISPNTDGKNTFQFDTGAAIDDARLLMKSVDTVKVDIQANGHSYFNGGNVGIGATSNSAEDTNNGVPKLQVNTTTAVLGEFPLAARFTTNSDAGDNSGVSVLINSGNDRGLMISAGRQSGNVSKVTLNVVKNDGDEIDTITLLQNGASGSSANVGIGTDSPGESLEILKDGGAIIKLHDPGNNSWKIKADSNFHIYDDSNSDYLTILNSGNVGIGTTGPGEKLTVISSTANTWATSIENTAANGTSFGLEIVAGSNNGDKALAVRNKSSIDLMVVRGDGNVGIGTTAPAKKLEIATPVSSISGSSTDEGAVLRLSSFINYENGYSGEAFIGGLEFYTGDSSGSGPQVFGAIKQRQLTYYNQQAMCFFTAPYDGALAERMRIDSAGAVQFNAYGAGTLVTDASGNITVSSGGGAGGPYLPLTGGIMNTGATIDMRGNLRFASTNVGTSPERFIQYNNADVSVENALGFSVGGLTTVYGDMNFLDDVVAKFGTGHDLRIQHTGSQSYIQNYTGDLQIQNVATDKDILFRADDGSGSVTTYFRLDGGSELTFFSKAIQTADNAKIFVGDAGDLQIYHDGSNSYIYETGTGSLFLQASDIFLKTNSSENAIACASNGAVSLYYDNSKKFETTSTGVKITGGLQDVNSSLGTAGQVLSSTGTTIDWVNPGSGLTAGNEIDISTNTINVDLSEATVITDSDDLDTFVVVTGDSENGRITPANIDSSLFTRRQVILNAGFYDSSTSTSRQWVPIAGSVTESTSNQYYNGWVAPYDGRVRKMIMKHMSGTTPTAGSLSTRLVIGVNQSGSASYESNYLATNGTGYYQWIVKDAINQSFSEGDRVFFGYQTNNTQAYWYGSAMTIVIEFD